MYVRPNLEKDGCKEARREASCDVSIAAARGQRFLGHFSNVGGGQQTLCTC